MSATARLADPLAARYAAVRAQTEALCRPLAVEDYGVQPMVDASPPKWHLAHTTWFFETFVLKAFVDGYRPVHESYEDLFNSYYNGIGQPYPRSRRGLLSRPTVEEVFDYRHQVDAALANLLERQDRALNERVELGLNHEQQHQELILTDLKVTLGRNPLKPCYRSDLASTDTPRTESPAAPLAFQSYAGGVVAIGKDQDDFCFDNERPRHDVLLRSFALAERLVTNGEFLEFMADGGYDDPTLWMAEGWAKVQEAGWRHPLYWSERAGVWFEYRLAGERTLVIDDPVVHVSGFEADAFARWAGYRLATEFEWEAAAAGLDPGAGNFLEADILHPAGAGMQGQLFGDAWEWTSSAYGPYPGYRTLPGTLGEYNGKFMSSQLVLRGGSCATPRGHVRASYRNFFYPPDRWQFTGIRLARDV